MMTKYQVVFLKLETSLKKIISSNEWREEQRKRRGFLKMAENAVKSHAVSKKTRQLINAKTERVCSNLVKISEKFNLNIIKSFNEWRAYTDFRKAEENVLHANNKKLAEISDNVEKNQKKLESLSKRKDDLENDLKDLKKRKKEQQDYLKDLENEKQSLE